MEFDFKGKIWFWRGPSPFYWITVPDKECEKINIISGLVTYGWGMIPVNVKIGKTLWKTSMFPKDGRYIIPIKDMVRKAEKLDEGDTVKVHLEVIKK
jgi:hypothetical protein